MDDNGKGPSAGLSYSTVHEKDRADWGERTKNLEQPSCHIFFKKRKNVILKAIVWLMAFILSVRAIIFRLMRMIRMP